VVIDHLVLARMDGSNLKEDDVRASGEVRHGATIELHLSSEVIGARITQIDDRTKVSKIGEPYATGQLTVTATELATVIANLGMAFEAQGSARIEQKIPIETDTTVQADQKVLVESSRAFRPEYVQALTLIAQACEDVARRGHPRPILVGGGAVEFHTRSDIVSGDFDFVVEEQQVFEEALISHGFRWEDRPGWLLVGLYHPELDLGVQFVSGSLFDGNSDEKRIQLVEIANGNAVAIAPIEDLIADRLGQYVATASRPPEPMAQAVALYKIAFDLDEAYLDRRIREDTFGELGLADLRERAT
jgi:hypothetical protein